MKKVGPMFFCLLLGGCFSGEETSQPEQPAIEVEYSKSLLQQSWPVRLAKAEQRQVFEGSEGWINYYNKDYSAALSNLQGSAQARVHLELSALYRQAALMHAYATEHIYGPPKNDIPLSEALYFRGAARSFLGRTEEAQADLKQFLIKVPEQEKNNSADRNKMRSQAQQWLDFQSTSELALSGFFFTQEESKPGMTPQIDGPQHYLITDKKETLPDSAPITISASEGTSLYLRAHWHQKAAQQLLGPQEQWLLDAWLLPWSVPIDSFAQAGEEQPADFTLSDDWLFLGYHLVPADVVFLAELATWKEWKKTEEWTDDVRGYNESKLKAHIERFKSTSLLAAALAPALEVRNISTGSSEDEAKEEKRLLLVPDILLELASKLKEDSFAQMKEQSTQVEPIFQTFSSFSEIALLRAGMLVAEVNGQYRDAGIIRLNINDIVDGPTKDPLFHISMGAWDVGNKYTMRAQDFIHSYSEQSPALEIARIPLDKLHIRLGRETATSGPAH
ncbi:MAG: hypothetical protein CMK59_09350 [Proteobacteria bacterium]|nr:hypothetical protein [Pseudomonadota bacterium]